MHALPPQPVPPTVEQTTAPIAATQSPCGLQLMTVALLAIFVLAQQMSLPLQSSELRQQPESAAQVPGGLQVAGFAS